MSDVGGFEGKILCEVPQSCAPCDSRDTCDTTTSEQLAEIEGQAKSTPATGYTPPEGWRVLAVGEILQAGDIWVNHEGESRPTKRVGERVNDELYIRCDPIEPEPQPEPQPPMLQDADQMIRLLSEANHNHVAMIGRLQGRIFDLETINQAMEKAVNDAGKTNNKLRTQAEEFRFEISYLQNLLGEEKAKQADKLAQLEVLQPIAAACHTAQTMVRDMLGHMRCLLALQHTTDRRNFCTLLESILEVFDDAECDEGDEDDDTTCTSEAGQG